MSYRVKSIFYTLQGEGAHQGRPSVFCRFSRCNLWNGREEDRDQAICRFCDTDFVGTDGPGGGVYPSAAALAAACCALWPGPLPPRHPEQGAWLVCTGGEPALQLDQALVDALQQCRFMVAIETNGTRPLPEGLDWVCLSPKAGTTLAIDACDELKLVFPQEGIDPSEFAHFPAGRRYLSPMADPKWVAGGDPRRETHLRLALDYCLQHPSWRLTQQTHKLLGID